MVLARFKCPDCRGYGYLPESNSQCPRCKGKLIREEPEPIEPYSECPFCGSKEFEKDVSIHFGNDFGYKCLDPDCQSEWVDDEPEEIPTEEIWYS
jgi:predicted Zn-ribbon and HTH transcriptional regulator